MVAAETAEFEAFDAHTDFEADLDTDADQHLRRRSGAKQEQMFDECVEAGLRPAWTRQSPVTTQ